MLAGSTLPGTAEKMTIGRSFRSNNGRNIRDQSKFRSRAKPEHMEMAVAFPFQLDSPSIQGRKTHGMVLCCHFESAPERKERITTY